MSSCVLAKVELENSSSTNSFRVLYYGVGSSEVSVPFRWESQPGTPKHSFSRYYDSTPPLTPPPSYYSNSSYPLDLKSSSKPPLLITSLFSKLTPKKVHISPSSATSSSSSSSPLTSMMDGNFSKRQKRILDQPRTAVDYRKEEEDSGSPTSTLCFGCNVTYKTKNGRIGCNSLERLKSALRFIVGHGSTSRP